MVCWGDSNRSVLIRVPLGWIDKTNMIKDANPQERGIVPYIPGKQTVEFRVPDGSADLYHLLAGMILAAKEGILSNTSLEKANELYVDVNIFEEKHILHMIKNIRQNYPPSLWNTVYQLTKQGHITDEIHQDIDIAPKK